MEEEEKDTLESLSRASHVRRAARFNAAYERERAARHVASQSSIASIVAVAIPAAARAASPDESYKHCVPARAAAFVSAKPAAHPDAEADAEAHRILTAVFGSREQAHVFERPTGDPEAERILASRLSPRRAMDAVLAPPKLTGSASRAEAADAVATRDQVRPTTHPSWVPDPEAERILESVFGER
jgi:hypothetical protein